MSPSLLVCTMVVIAGAMAAGMPMSQEMVGIQSSHVPCDAPLYFTFDEVDVMSSVSEGSLLVEYVNFDGAYDAKAQQFSVRTTVDYFNGTLYTTQTIEDYKEEKAYMIYNKTGHELVCVVDDIAGKKFPYQYFIPATAKFVAEETIGDRDLVVDKWFEKDEAGNKHTIKTVTRGECIPVAIVQRRFDPATDKEIQWMESRIHNFHLGICDREKYFKIPAECQQGIALKDLTAGEMYQQYKKLRRFRDF
ncbi:uncharacterized protein LOC119738308 [Patiria miniata]|uniref:Uncharacterized protein n=1 Tax=Patiria miniata TaxID=46514 RepID=A0A914B0Q4_PATMI|nr:uncharacterized protein LOC119738308 [Patiria miniata]